MSADHEQPHAPGRRQSLMTLRVYTASPDGAVREERREVHVLASDPVNVYGLAQEWPPCACPRHQGRQ
ncbi:hypothetical protein [Streptomyces halobius]|uniref:Uncharacterized protein n=1 Tax=Streptomyces halobius TaxID=2879846 RepID=A0ABY4MA92_9ACTN|nr:hypothetical protein [Streptomyces halobius]UQA93325.1 hypothetical protein K9S39_17055 [Streptomyces halobius]